MNNLIVFIVLLIHGIGHLQGVFVSFGLKDFGGWNANSWILKNWISEGMQRHICLLLFLITSLLTLATAFSFKGLLIPHSWWHQLILVAAIISSMALILFPNSFAMLFNKIGAVAVNLIIFYSILNSSEWIEKLS